MLVSVYYALKPYLPVRLRYWLRSRRAERLRVRFADTWPIDPAAARKPDGWRGWPGGKKFAFVLTHDVEGGAGYDKVRALADLEAERGFRSAFHFIPEGSYTVSLEMRRDLEKRGFEVGVHDLRHDGSLYRSRADFIQQAPRIRRILNDWGAGGFRAGFMFHNLDWIPELGCSHDLSTFDTDPFEPQPDGMRTIFPFLLKAKPHATRTAPPFAPTSTHSDAPFRKPNSPRLAPVELPYTLAQDSTLFLILKENSPRIWLEKLDWVAAHGGMALVNVHPDYVAFDGEAQATSTFPVAHYRALLDHVRGRYGEAAWYALPREVAEWVRHDNP